MLNCSVIRVVACDVLGTIVNASGGTRPEFMAYADHVRKPEWSPLELPTHWQNFRPHADAIEGLRRLRFRYRVVTCSNAPLGFLANLSHNAGLKWDAIVPLEANRVFKPDNLAYQTVCEVMCCQPEQVLMVTANTRLPGSDIGDVQGAALAGMQSILIRGDDGGPKTIIELAEMLGC